MTTQPSRGAALAAASGVLDPELPVLTLADLGVLRGVEEYADRAVVTLTPTYTGCPAMAEIRADVHRAVRAAGYAEVEVRTQLSPAWTTDDITEQGREKLAAAGIAPPGPVLLPFPRVGGSDTDFGADRALVITCPRCGSTRTQETSRFGPTACTSLWRCTACTEPFEHLKEL